MKDVRMYVFYLFFINKFDMRWHMAIDSYIVYEWNWMSFILLLLQETMQYWQTIWNNISLISVCFNRIAIVALYFRSKPSVLNVTFDLIPLHIAANCKIEDLKIYHLYLCFLLQYFTYNRRLIFYIYIKEIQI